VIGGCNSNSKATANKIDVKNPELILGVGDYSYQPTATCWFNIIKNIDENVKIAFGNHEGPDEGKSSYMKKFGLSKTYYSFNYQNIHILVMDSETSFKKGSSQYKFVDSDLK